LSNYLHALFNAINHAAGGAKTAAGMAAVDPPSVDGGGRGGEEWTKEKWKGPCERGREEEVSPIGC